MALNCDICSEEIEKLELGLFSWKEEDGKISNFLIHHKHSCDVQENNSWIPLYLLTNPKVLCNSLMGFLRLWKEGKELKQYKKLEKAYTRLFPYVLREMDEKEQRDWIGYTSRVLPLKFPGEE